MIELFQPLSSAAPGFDGWLPVLLPGDTTDDVALGPLAVGRGPSLGYPAAPLAIDELDLPGAKLANFGGDLYERIHLSEALLDLGNVIGQQQRAITVWNAYTRAQNLAAITEDNGEGLTLSSVAGSPPYPFGPLGEQAYTLTVSTEGPPTIDATYTFDFAPYDLVLRVTGSRVIAWTFLPDWSSPIIERMDWLTDVMVAYDAREQRGAVRLAPRKSYEFEAFFIGGERRYAESLLWGWGARVWALPIWPDGVEIGVDLAAGATSINIAAETRDFAADSLAVILTGPREFEVIELLTVSAGAITLKRPTGRDWPSSATIYPARLARLQDQVRLPRWDGSASGARALFSLVEPVDYTADAGAASYRSLPVLESRPNWAGGYDLELVRKLAEVDNQTGRQFYEDEAELALPLQRMSFYLEGRDAGDSFRRLLYALKGRFRAIWVPTWADDLILQTLVPSSQTFIDVDWTGYTRQIAQQPNRRDIRIELTDGTVLYRRITGSQELSAESERLAIDSALGRNVQPSEVVQISYLALCRLNADGVELAHWTGEFSEAALVFRGMRSDL